MLLLIRVLSLRLALRFRKLILRAFLPMLSVFVWCLSFSGGLAGRCLACWFAVSVAGNCGCNVLAFPFSPQNACCLFRDLQHAFSLFERWFFMSTAWIFLYIFAAVTAVLFMIALHIDGGDKNG